MDKRQQIPDDCAALIKARLTMPEVLRRYGVRIDQHHRTQCFLHGGQHRNMRVYENGAHCFVCNQSADIIDYMMRSFGLTYTDAIRQIDRDFSLGLIGCASPDKTAQIHKEIQARRKAERERIAALQVKISALDALSRLCGIAREVQSRCMPLSDEWCTATDLLNRADIAWWDEFNEMAELEDAGRGI